MRKEVINHLGMALFVFVALTGLFLWMTGTVHFGAPKVAQARDQKDGHDNHEKVLSDAYATDLYTSDQCPEHGVAESECTRCNPSLISAFKSKGDWCSEHGLPES